MSATILSKKAACATIDCTYEEEYLTKSANLTKDIYEALGVLEKEVSAIDKNADIKVQAHLYCDNVVTSMNNLRKCVDAIEPILSKEFYPFPTYGDLFYNI